MIDLVQYRAELAKLSGLKIGEARSAVDDLHRLLKEGRVHRNRDAADLRAIADARAKLFPTTPRRPGEYR